MKSPQATILYEPPVGDVVKVGKFVINKSNERYLDVVVVSIERIDEVPHFRISTGGDDEFRIIGREQWQQFLGFLKQINWVSEETSELQVLQESEPIHDTWDRKLHHRGNTLVDVEVRK